MTPGQRPELVEKKVLKHGLGLLALGFSGPEKRLTITRFRNRHAYQL
jgi:hypothetical protein